MQQFKEKGGLYMTPLVKEWFGKADKDYNTIIALADMKNHSFDEFIGFNCQKCVEKYLKHFYYLIISYFKKLIQ